MKFLLGGLFILLLGVSSSLAQARCRVPGLSDWILYGSNCYQFFSRPEPFSRALVKCQAFGGTLASVTSAAENNLIIGLITARSSGTPRTWLGGQRQTNKGNFAWLDRRTFSYSRWAKHEPNNLFGPENCLEINYNGVGLWNDVRCHRQKPYVCQRRKS